MAVQQNMGLTKRRFLTIGGSVGTTVFVAGCAGNEEASAGNEGASFELMRSNVQEASITVDDTLTASATVENVGDLTGTAAVSFSFDVSEETKETGEIEPGDAEQVVAEIEPPLVDPMLYTLTIELEGEQADTVPVALFDTIDESGIYGSVFSESDLDFSDAEIRLGTRVSGERREGTLDISETNQFREPGEAFADLSIDLTLISSTPGEFDGIPVIITLTDDYTVTNDIEFLGPYEIPEAYRTEIQLVDEDGNPIPDFTFPLRAATGVGILATTNENGYVITSEGTETGLSLPPENESNIRIDAEPEGSGRAETIGEVYGSKEGEEFVFEVSDPGRFTQF